MTRRDIFDPALFTGPATYMGVPFSHDLSDAKAAILGVPFDCGRHPTRIGSRYGPAAIRQQSPLVRELLGDAGLDPLAELGAVDCGDVRVTPGVIDSSFANIEAAVHRIAAAGAVPVTMGGDGAVTLPQLRALHRVHDGLCVLHFDAHTDTYAGSGDDTYNNATTFTRAAEEGIVDVSRSIHVGCRGPIDIERIAGQTIGHGYELIDARAFFRRGSADVVAHIKERLASRPVYLCFDMDFFDPSVAPGVCTPTWGGASAREGIELLRALSGLRIVAVDVNTVSPPHDVNGQTAFLAAQMMLEAMALIARGRRNQPPA
jgi:agmatinase